MTVVTLENQNKSKISMKINLRDINHCPWCWQDKNALRLIRKLFFERPKRQTTCLTIYMCLTELASNNNSSDSFCACNATIAKMAGKSISTIKTYCNVLITLGLLYKKERKRGKQNLANEWFLLETPNIPDNNNYPTPDTNNSNVSGNYNSPVLEDNLKENNLIDITNPLVFESEGHKKCREIAQSLKLRKI